MSVYEFTVLDQWVKRIAPVAEKLQPELFQSYTKLLEEKKAQPLAEVVVYGIYSNGKSSLVNALLGKECALVGVCPTTDSVTQYPWRGCVLLDTPGIDAPIEHQAIAEEQLKKSELVIFVVQSMNIEDSRVWQEIVTIVERNQKVILVVNDFERCRAEGKVAPLSNKFRENLQKEAAQRSVTNIVEKVPFYFVNVAAALKGRLEKKENLVASSGLLELEAGMEQALATVNVKDSINALKNNFVQLVDLCLCSSAGKENALLLGQAQKTCFDVVAQKDLAHSRIFADLEKVLVRYANETRAVFEGAGDESAKKAALAAVQQKIGDEMAVSVQKHLEYAQRNVQNLCVDLSKVATTFVEGPFVNTASDSTEKNILDLAKQLDLAPLLKNIKWEQTAEEAIKVTLTFAKKYLPDVFRGIGEKTIGRWAGMAAKMAGPAITAGTIVYSFIQASKEEEAQRQAAVRKVQQIEDAVRSINDGIRQAYQGQIAETLEQMFDPIIKDLERTVTQMEVQVVCNDQAATILAQAKEAVIAL